MSNLAVGVEFAGCRVQEMIGRGGMGVVYRGIDQRLGRPVAIKLIAAEYATDAAVRRRFEREARLMAAIDHPNVIPVYAAGEEDGHLYLVMRYVAGTDLHHMLKDRGQLEPGEAARIVSDLGSALDAAHAAGLVHRDIKPANVLLAGDHVYLTDFGITRAVDSGTKFTDSDEWVGTVDYMSPEHLRGTETDGRSDVYSLGCLLYACLTGTPPFRRTTAAATILAHIEDPPPKPSQTAGVPDRFDPVIAKALAKSPADRYATAGELGAAALGAAAERSAPPLVINPRPEQPSIPGPVPTERARPPKTRIMEGAPPRTEQTSRLRFFDGSRRRPRMLATIGLLLAAGVAAAAVIAVLATRTTPTPKGPLSAAEVTGAARAFAAAYGSRDRHALARVLAPEVTRISTTVTQRGRAAVLAEYVRQFRHDAITGYTLSDTAVVAGRAGRLSAHYTVALRGGGTITGSVVFGVERIAGRPMIALIVTQQSG
jgi:serine/threonine-protein kinase